MGCGFDVDEVLGKEGDEGKGRKEGIVTYGRRLCRPF